jgi:YNFM family putative membrane transporter
MAGFLLGATGMFAAMYETQAILPLLSEAYRVSPAQAGLTISVLLAAISVAAWLWGPLSDRIGRRSSLILASSLLVLPTLALPLARSFPVLLALRAVQGLCMPGLLTVGVAYVAEAYAPELGGQAMGWYLVSLVVGGLIGRLVPAALANVVGWRWALAGLAVLPLAASIVMARTLPELAPPRHGSGRRAVGRLLRNSRLWAAAAGGGGLFFAFVGAFSYVTFRLEAAPYRLGTAAAALVFAVWVFGAVGPAAGRLADRVGWRRVLAGAVTLAGTGLGLTLAGPLPVIALGLALMAVGMFTGSTAAQLGVAASSVADRGAAAGIYFSCYYGAGTLAGFLPGLAWQHARWGGVVALTAAVLAGALAVLAVAGRPPAAARLTLPG